MAKFVIAGRADCPGYARAEMLADTLAAKLPHFNVNKVGKGRLDGPILTLAVHPGCQIGYGVAYLAGADVQGEKLVSQRRLPASVAGTGGYWRQGALFGRAEGV